MKGPQILYGIRGSELVHIDDAARGQACNCTCPLCGRNLIARKGEVLTHFFAHEADEVDCNPSPESLVHSYAKQQLSKLKHLVLPGFEVNSLYQSHDGEVHELFWRHIPTYCLEVKAAEVESRRYDGVVPDVLYFTERGWVALEVYYRHAVPKEKVDRLTEDLGLTTLEINVSDLPTNASAAAIECALTQSLRWKWLNNGCKAWEERSLQSALAYSKKILIPDSLPGQPRVAGSTVPSKLIMDASSAFNEKKAQQLVAELRALPPATRPQRIRPVERELRLALHCLQIGLKPTQLPPHLMQTVTRQSVLGVPTILWQTGLFAKFCMVGKQFTAKQAALWLRMVFPGLTGARAILETANGFNEYSEATFNFLNALSAQGLLQTIRGKRRWEAEFAPAGASKAEILALLLEQPPALEAL